MYVGGETAESSGGEHGRWWLLDAVMRLVMREVGLARVATSLVVCDACSVSCDVDGRCGVDVSSFSVNANWLAKSGGNKLVPLCRNRHSVHPRDVVLASELLSDWSVGNRPRDTVEFSVVNLVVMYHGADKAQQLAKVFGGEPGRGRAKHSATSQQAPSSGCTEKNSYTVVPATPHTHIHVRLIDEVEHDGKRERPQ